MRLRKKWWARPELEESPLFITNPQEYNNKWKEEFKNDNEIHLELGCGRGKFINDKATYNPELNFIGIDLKDEVLIYTVRKIIESELLLFYP